MELVNKVKINGIIQGFKKGDKVHKLSLLPIANNNYIVKFNLKHNKYFLNMVAFGEVAKTICEANKGSEIIANGKLQTYIELKTNIWKTQILIESVEIIKQETPIVPQETSQNENELNDDEPW